MKIVRTSVLKSEKRIPITIIVISVFMFLISIFDITLIFEDGTVALSITTLGIWSSLLSIIPLSWGLCTFLLMKFKKINFAKMPSYITCAMIVLGYIIYYIMAGENNIVNNILFFSIAILLIYPFIISCLTIEGRIYNRVFATIFSGILIAISLMGAVIYYILKGSIVITLLIPALMYIELLLIVFCFRLEKTRMNTEKTNKITH